MLVSRNEILEIVTTYLQHTQMEEIYKINKKYLF